MAFSVQHISNLHLGTYLPADYSPAFVCVYINVEADVFTRGADDVLQLFFRVGPC